MMHALEFPTKELCKPVFGLRDFVLLGNQDLNLIILPALFYGFILLKNFNLLTKAT